MTRRIARLRDLRMRQLRDAMSAVQVVRQALAAAQQALAERKRLRRRVEAQLDDVASWLADSRDDPALRTVALARQSVLVEQSCAAAAACHAQAEVTLRAEGQVQEALRLLAQARARQEAVEALAGKLGAERARRREHLGELEQEDRLAVPGRQGLAR